MMLVHMDVHLKGYFLMSISLQKYTVWKSLEKIIHLHNRAASQQNQRISFVRGDFKNQ